MGKAAFWIGQIKYGCECYWNDMQATVGGVARDSNGKWMWGFAAKVRRMEVDRAELQAVRAVLQIAREYRILRTCVEMDLAVVFSWLSNPVLESLDVQVSPC